MSYSIDFDEQAGWVVLTQWGSISIPELEEARSNVNEKLYQLRCEKLLVDTLGVTSQLSTFEYYTFASAHPENLPLRLHIALIVSPERMADGRFVENVLVNRGMMTRVFTDREEAIDWLRPNSA